MTLCTWLLVPHAGRRIGSQGIFRFAACDAVAVARHCHFRDHEAPRSSAARAKSADAHGGAQWTRSHLQKRRLQEHAAQWAQYIGETGAVVGLIVCAIVLIGLPLYVGYSVSLSGRRANQTNAGLSKPTSYPLQQQSPKGVAPSPAEEDILDKFLRETEPLVQKATADEFKLTVTPPPSQEIVLPNGHVLRNDLPRGFGRLTIKNGTGSHALVKLVGQPNGTPAATMFIRTASEAQINDIPDGNYKLLFRLGRGWSYQTGDFAQPHGTSAFKDALQFRAQSTTRGVVYDTLTATLHGVRGGTARTDTISEADFEKY